MNFAIYSNGMGDGVQTTSQRLVLRMPAGSSRSPAPPASCRAHSAAGRSAAAALSAAGLCSRTRSRLRLRCTSTCGCVGARGRAELRSEAEQCEMNRSQNQKLNARLRSGERHLLKYTAIRVVRHTHMTGRTKK